MVSFNNRLRKLESTIDARNPNALAPVPSAWLERDEYGELIGPGPGDRPTPGQISVFRQLVAMDLVTAPPPPHPL